MIAEASVRQSLRIIVLSPHLRSQVFAEEHGCFIDEVFRQAILTEHLFTLLL